MEIQIKVRTQGRAQFKGDTFKRVEVEVSRGVWHTVFGVYKTCGRYKNDTLSGYEYYTLTEAKNHALQVYLNQE